VKESLPGSSSNGKFKPPLSSLRGGGSIIDKLVLFGRRRRGRRSTKPGDDDVIKCSSSSTVANSTALLIAAGINHDGVAPDLPVAVWMDGIFPFLNRASQNCLASAHPDVALARRESYYNKRGSIIPSSLSSSSSLSFSMQWPSGTLSKKLSRPVKRVVFSPDDCTLLVAYCKPKKVAQYDKLTGPINNNNNSPRNATAANAATTTPLLLLFDPRYRHPGMVSDLQYSPRDATILATASRNDGTIRLWREVGRPVDNDKDGCVDGGNNNSYTTSTTRQQQQQQQQPPYRYICFRILQVYQADLRYMTWSRDGSKIASWGKDGFLRISNACNGTLQSRHWKTRLEVYGCHLCAAFDPITGRTVAFAHNHDVVCIWDYSSGTNTSFVLPNVRDEYGTYAGNFVTGLTYSPDGKWLVVGCHVALVKFWHVVVPASTRSSRSGSHDDNTPTNDDDNSTRSINQPLLEYAFAKEIHVGSGWSAVAHLTFTPDSRYLACTNAGKQIRIIDVTSNEVVATLKGHVGVIESLAFTSNGKTLSSGSCDRTVRFWDSSLWARSSNAGP
jgi:WD40 repeat protein